MLKGVSINARFRSKPDALVWRGDYNDRVSLIAWKSGMRKAMPAGVCDAEGRSTEAVISGCGDGLSETLSTY
jgi:hypothetical protein